MLGTTLGKALATAEPDMVRDLLKRIVEQQMGVEVDAMCGATYKSRSKSRENTRNGHRARPWDTRGSIELAVPRVRSGSYFPHWLLEPRQRAAKALVAVIAEAYVAGVSTRRVERLAQDLASSLDHLVSAFRDRPLDREYPYVWVDGMAVKCREQRRIVNVCLPIATGVNRDGRREVLGLDVITGDDGSGWLVFLKKLTARVQLVVSDSHSGLKAAIAAALPGAAWQRCRTHFMRNLLCRLPKSAQDFLASAVRTIFPQGPREEVLAQHGSIVTQLETKFSDAATMLTDAGVEILTFADFPKQHWKQIWSPPRSGSTRKFAAGRTS